MPRKRRGWQLLQKTAASPSVLLLGSAGSSLPDSECCSPLRCSCVLADRSQAKRENALPKGRAVCRLQSATTADEPDQECKCLYAEVRWRRQHDKVRRTPAP